MAGKLMACFVLAIAIYSSAFGCNYYPLRVPEALDSALKHYDETKARLAATTDVKEATELVATLELIATEVDEIAGQRHATVSRLFWYTDLDQAQIAAAETGKPILSLRMLGNLTDEFSCANSRYFRTTLYANKEISDYLRDNFVLHWQSVRPVPKVTIDFGDGRQIRGTLTGNSAHFALTPDGRPLDVLPGLYSPQEFLRWLERTKILNSNYMAATNTEQQRSVLVDYHQQRHADAGAFKLNRQDVLLDDASMQLIRAELPTAVEAAKVAVSKTAVEDPLLRVVSQFRSSIAEDTVRNETELHRKIHEWFIAGEAGESVDALNDRVYAELFLTPSSDPWLGLAPRDAFTALENGGLVIEAR